MSAYAGSAAALAALLKVGPLHPPSGASGGGRHHRATLTDTGDGLDKPLNAAQARLQKYKDFEGPTRPASAGGGMSGVSALGMNGVALPLAPGKLFSHACLKNSP